MFTSDGRCTFTPLIAPGISGVAMVDGMPAYGCEVTPQYNMNAYRARTAAQSAAETSDAAVCGKVRARGFRKAIILDAPDGSPPRWKRVDCYLP